MSSLDLVLDGRVLSLSLVRSVGFALLQLLLFLGVLLLLPCIGFGFLSGLIPLELIEVQVGAYLGEDDVIRLEDAYNRPTRHHS